jgi:uncharacterized membrane protein YqjE
MGGTFLAILQNRLDLVSVEASEELFRLLEVIFLGIAFFFVALLGLLVLTVAVLIMVGMQWQPLVLAGFALFYMGAAVAALVALLRRVKTWPPPFSSAIQELKKDLECLRPKN